MESGFGLPGDLDRDPAPAAFPRASAVSTRGANPPSPPSPAPSPCFPHVSLRQLSSLPTPHLPQFPVVPALPGLQRAAQLLWCHVWPWREA